MEAAEWVAKARQRGMSEVQINGVLLAMRRGHLRLIEGGVEVTDEGRAWLAAREGKLN
jgi:hypothetical protein